VLDLKVKVLFDEDMKTMCFPLVKEFIFRTSADSTLEIAAKALAQKNKHPNLWEYYCFSAIRTRKIGEDEYEKYEVQISNLKKNFGDYKDEFDQNVINLFYKINANFVSPFNNLFFDESMMMITNETL